MLKGIQNLSAFYHENGVQPLVTKGTSERYEKFDKRQDNESQKIHVHAYDSLYR